MNSSACGGAAEADDDFATSFGDRRFDGMEYPWLEEAWRKRTARQERRTFLLGLLLCSSFLIFCLAASFATPNWEGSGFFVMFAVMWLVFSASRRFLRMDF